MAKAIVDIAYGRKIDQPCLLRSELMYSLLRLVDHRGEYKVNLVVTFYCSGDKGHAWLSRNGKPVFPYDKRVRKSDFTIIGESKRYRYYIKESNLRKWHDIDLPQCHDTTAKN